MRLIKRGLRTFDANRLLPTTDLMAPTRRCVARGTHFYGDADVSATRATSNTPGASLAPVALHVLCLQSGAASRLRAAAVQTDSSCP